MSCASDSEPDAKRLEPTATSASDTKEAPLAEDKKDTKASREGHLIIGNLIDTSGSLADFGEAHRNAAELADRHITEAVGTPVTIVHRDTGTNTAKGVEAASGLIDDAENVAAIVGARSSEVTIAVAESVTVLDEILLI